MISPLTGIVLFFLIFVGALLVRAALKFDRDGW